MTEPDPTSSGSDPVTDDAAENAERNRFAVFAAYGAAMLDFQMLDLTLWALVAQLPELPKLKKADPRADNLDLFTQYMSKTPTGQLSHTAKPVIDDQDLFDELMAAVHCRNHLAHEFLRSFAVIPPTNENRDAAIADLRKYRTKLAALEQRLEAVLPELPELDDETLAEIDAMRPTRWGDM